MLKTTLMFAMLLTSSLTFAGIHDACHTGDKDSRVFAVAYTGAVIDLKSRQDEGRQEGLTTRTSVTLASQSGAAGMRRGAVWEATCTAWVCRTWGFSES